jgi:hypothetical protein
LEPHSTVPTLVTDPPSTKEFVVVMVHEIGAKFATNVWLLDAENIKHGDALIELLFWSVQFTKP